MRLASRVFLVAALALASPPAARAQDAATDSMLTRWNTWAWQLNAEGGRRLSDLVDRIGLGGESTVAVLEPLGRAAFNWVNEPVSVVSHLVAGEMQAAWNHTQRFAINSTLGIAGLFDRAAERGLPPNIADLGLALCRRGVPAGPFVVVPILGPRTLRDALSDVVASNLIVLAMLSPFVGTVLSVEALVAVMVLDEAAVLAVARTMDPEAGNTDEVDYDTMRDRYLARRAERCAEGAGQTAGG